ncbi:3'-5' exoribonuclease YhaM family protein [Paenibacillus thermotolerans]|uniref:3'-5' exoribonuclease YhaM family protein n=1 Tax=Paenibacillus thermotolerans TaxID=3027807 RepID=UPI0023686A93|nr:MULTISPECIES: HD domain-containing protein [unclassified Paenibacillus]
MTLIKTFAVGEEITGFYLLKGLDLRQTRSTPPKDYFDIILCDASGEIPAKFWDVTPTDKETFFAMDVVKVQGTVQTYNDKLQFKINRIRKANEEDGVTLTDFIRSAPIAPVDLVHIINRTAESIGDLVIRQIVLYCIQKVGDKLMHFPAAKGMHHAYYAGLAYHICRMLEVGEFICRKRPFLNPDLVRAGIILHDIAKTEEMESQLGIVSDYSLKGKLLGHITMVYGWIIEAVHMNGLDPNDERILALQHIVLSHHNLGEWGSPVQPQLPEAVALHYIDQLDAKLQMVEDALDTTPETEQWTPTIRGLENKAIFRLRGSGLV